MKPRCTSLHPDTDAQCLRIDGHEGYHQGRDGREDVSWADREPRDRSTDPPDDRAGTKRPCRACGAEIEVYLFTGTKKRVYVQRVPRAYQMIGGALTGTLHERDLFVDHRDTCPQYHQRPPVGAVAASGGNRNRRSK